METDTSPVGQNSASFSWRKEFLLAAAMVVSIIASHILVSWYKDRDIRPFQLAGLVLFMSTAFAMGTRRRWNNARHPQSSRGTYKFSLAELLIYATGLAFFFGFLAADRLESQRFQREREQLQSAVGQVLGPDGRITFMPDDSLQIAICDRTFDDERFARLAEMISHLNTDTKVSGVMFGTGANTNNTPPVWPGITDQSIPLLMQWQELEWLSLYGTAISANGREQLQSLLHLNEHSRRELAKKELNHQE